MRIPVVDIFAGPGGLGEGFSSFATETGASGFDIAISAEKDPVAWRTLRLRAFLRQFDSRHIPASYYEYVQGLRSTPWKDRHQSQWDVASREARMLSLGLQADDDALDQVVSNLCNSDRAWVLIGGPPCQAYSLVGRARNKGIPGYTPEQDHRHFLYQHYLRLLGRYRPAAFVMENVKGILSSRVNGERLFHRILEDLHEPAGPSGPRYRIVPLVPTEGSDLFTKHQPSDYVVRAERFGVPQARHRVILVGVLEDTHRRDLKLEFGQTAHVRDVIGDLPPRRSGTTTPGDPNWSHRARQIFRHAAHAAGNANCDVAARLLDLASIAATRDDVGRGEQWTDQGSANPKRLRSWYLDHNVKGFLNHESRAHMDADLARYAFASVFAELHGTSPRAEEFPELLAPLHQNWLSGKFVDRFKVQRFDAVSSTITSHLSKDGHYFIHPDPLQLRSLTVREAARLQTFPDNYFFEGSRGKQFQQVGNAVPPWLARQIAEIVYQLLRP